MQPNEVTDPIIITHKDCTDGFASLWVLSKIWGPRHASYVGRQHGEAPPDVTGRHVIMADFTWPRPVMEEMLEKCASMQVYDHHASAKDALAGLEEHPKMLRLVFDMERSGAGIVADEFLGYRPWPINYVEDMDLWRFRFPQTKPIIAALRSHRYGLHRWTEWSEHREDQLDLLRDGAAVVRAKDQMVQQSVELAQEKELFGEPVLVANVPYFLCSEVAGALIRNNRVGITWFQDQNGLFRLSFRSTDGGSAREFAERLRDHPACTNAGGHGNSAGAGLTTLPW